jgi:hypothetical protein
VSKCCVSSQGSCSHTISPLEGCFEQCVTVCLPEKLTILFTVFNKFLLLCCVWVYCGICKSSYLQCIKYIILEFTPSTALLYSPLPHSWIVSTGIIFAFAYICTLYLHHIHPPTIVHCHFPPPTGTNTLLPTGPVLQFCRRKKEKKKEMTFLLV